MFDAIKEKVRGVFHRATTDWTERIGLETSYVIMKKTPIQDERISRLGIDTYVGISSPGVEITGFCDYPHGCTDFRDLGAGYFFLKPDGEKKTAILFFSQDGLMRWSDAQKKAIYSISSEKIGKTQALLVVDGTVIASGLKFEDTKRVVDKIKQLAL